MTQRWGILTWEIKLWTRILTGQMFGVCLAGMFKVISQNVKFQMLLLIVVNVFDQGVELGSTEKQLQPWAVLKTATSGFKVLCPNHSAFSTNTTVNADFLHLVWTDSILVKLKVAPYSFTNCTTLRWLHRVSVIIYCVACTSVMFWMLFLHLPLHSVHSKLLHAISKDLILFYYHLC